MPLQEDSFVDASIEEELTGCSATPCCDPRRTPHRYIVLIFICFLSFGSYFCFDNPAALQKHFLSDMDVNQQKFMGLYAWYSWPNVVLCFFGGFLLDRVFGIRLGCIIFSLFVCVGQVVFATGGLVNSFTLMDAGRFIFGIGGECMAVAQNTYSVAWFKGAELNMVFGLQLSFSRVGSTVNMNVMEPIYQLFRTHLHIPPDQHYKVLGWSLMFGFSLCILSLFCACMMAYFDKRAARILNKSAAKTGEVIRFSDVLDFPLSVWLIFLICVMYYVAIFPFIGLGQVFFQAKYDFSQSEASVINSLVYLISAGASPILGILVDKVGFNVFFLISAIIMTLASHAMLAFTFWNPYIAMVVMGIGYSLLACALWPLVSLVIPEHQLGTAYGFMQSIQNLGLALVALAAGAIVDTKGYLILEVFFLGCLSFSLIAAVVLYLVDLSRGNLLNMSAWKRQDVASKEKRLEGSTASVVGVRQKLLEDYYTTAPYGFTDNSLTLTGSTASTLRHRFLSRLGGAMFVIPEHMRMLPLANLSVLR